MGRDRWPFGFVSPNKRDADTALEQAVRENDGPLTGTTAHSLKGSLANFGFMDLARLAAALESSGKADQWLDAGQALEEFLPKCRGAREAVAEARRDDTK